MSGAAPGLGRGAGEDHDGGVTGDCRGDRRLSARLPRPGHQPNISISWPNLIVMIVLASWVSGALGLTIGTAFNTRQVPLIFSVIVIPVTFLGCVYYPWKDLSAIRWLQVGVLINPLVYVSEGLRGSLTPQFDHMSWLAVYAGALVALTVFTSLGLHGFRKRVVA